MIYVLFWWCSFLLFTTHVSAIHRAVINVKNPANLVGGIIGVVLRGLTFAWLFVLIYPLLSLIK